MNTNTEFDYIHADAFRFNDNGMLVVKQNNAWPCEVSQIEKAIAHLKIENVVLWVNSSNRQMDVEAKIAALVNVVEIRDNITWKLI
jgi:dihydroxyacetone kinase-like predicted kinase